jgi:anti-sigma B factor antagonist
LTLNPAGAIRKDRTRFSFCGKLFDSCRLIGKMLAMPPIGDYTIREIDGVTVVRLKFEQLFSVTDVSRVNGELLALVRDGTRKLVIDLKHVEFAGSSLLGLLIQMQKELDRVGGKLVLSHTERIEELLKVSRTRQLFKIAPDPKSAVALFSQR